MRLLLQLYTCAMLELTRLLATTVTADTCREVP